MLALGGTGCHAVATLLPALIGQDAEYALSWSGCGGVL